MPPKPIRAPSQKRGLQPPAVGGGPTRFAAARKS